MLEGLGPDNIQQSRRDYNEDSIYTVTFNPTNRVDWSRLTLYFSYPSSVAIPKDGITSTCSVKDGKVDDTCKYKDQDCSVTCGTGDHNINEFKCIKPGEKSRSFKVTKAIREGWGGTRKEGGEEVKAMCEIKVRLRNPPDNRSKIGFKLKTYEIYPENSGERYLVDRYDQNKLIPTLLCDSPCELCGERDLFNLRVRDYCTSCWTNSPVKYLMTKKVFDGVSGDSQCKGKCESGWTTNGNKDNICQKCDRTCATCEDDGDPGDRKKCTTCAAATTYLFPKTSECTTECGTGRYEIEGASTEKRCYECYPLCADCFGN